MASDPPHTTLPPRDLSLPAVFGARRRAQRRWQARHQSNSRHGSAAKYGRLKPLLQKCAVAAVVRLRSPGDTWELYVGKNNRLEEFVYHRAGAGAPKGYTGTWEGYGRAGPLLLSTDHEGTTDDGKSVRVFYSNVAVKVVGSDKWVNAQSASEKIASE